MTDRDKSRPDSTWEEEYNTEPQKISQRVSVAPTMAGGIALLIDGEHIDHFYENELEDLEEAVSAALNTIESTGHYTASERKFDRMIQESIGLQAEIMYYLYEARTQAEDHNYNAINYDTLKRVTSMLQSKVTLIEAMASQMESKKEQNALRRDLDGD